jgi:hypothetical protein
VWLVWLDLTGLMVWLRRLVWIMSWLKVIGLSGMAAPFDAQAAKRGEARRSQRVADVAGC